MGGVFLFQGRLNHAASARLHTGNLFLRNTRFNHLAAVLLKAGHQKKEGGGEYLADTQRLLAANFRWCIQMLLSLGIKAFFGDRYSLFAIIVCCDNVRQK